MTPKEIAENAATAFAGRTYITPEEAHADLVRLILAAADKITASNSRPKGIHPEWVLDATGNWRQPTPDENWNYWFVTPPPQ